MSDSNDTTFTDAEFYQRYYDCKEFYKMYLSDLSWDASLTFLLQQGNETFSSGNIKGKKLSVIGCGPTSYGIISASKYFEEIVVSDINDSNLREIEKWLRNEEGCLDWHPIIKFVCELEGRSSRSPEEVEQRLRQIVKQVLRCDVLQENPFHPLTMEPTDCIMSSFYLESVCKDLETYRRALERIAALLKPGGVLVLISLTKASFYFVGKTKFSLLFLSESFIKETLKNLGFSIKQVNSFPRKEINKVAYDAEACVYLVAQKTK